MALRRAHPTDVKRRARITVADAEGKYPKSFTKPDHATFARDSKPGEFKWTDESRKAIFQMVENGNPVSTAIVATIGTGNLKVWVDKAKKGEPEFVEFFSELRRNEKLALVRWEGMLETAARGDTLKMKMGHDEDGKEIIKELTPDVKALQFLLERRDPKHFGKTTKLEHSGKDGGPIPYTPPFQFNVDFRGWNDDEVLAYATRGVLPTRLAAIQTPAAEAKSIERELDDYLDAV